MSAGLRLSLQPRVSFERMRLDDSILIWAIKHGELLTYEHVAGELECTPRFVRTILARYPKIVKPIRLGHRTVRFDPFQILKLKHRIHREADERGQKLAKKKGGESLL